MTNLDLLFFRSLRSFLSKENPCAESPLLALFAQEISADFGIECVYQTVEDQLAWLEKYPEIRDELPWNSIQVPH